MALDEAAVTTPLLPTNLDKTTTTTTYQYDAIINTLSAEGRETILKMVASDLVRHAAKDISTKSIPSYCRYGRTFWKDIVLFS
jgi:hypothetical protein